MTWLLLPITAVVAGFVSFSSPCCIPLVPGYLSYISALPGTQDPVTARRTTIVAATRFVAGFTVVFTILGMSAGALGSLLLRYQDQIVRWSGVGIVVLGLATVGVLRVPVLQRETRPYLARVPRGPGWAFPLGMAFAAGWTPCVGPVLATILATASAGGSVAWGGALLALYGIGLGIPFILVALGWQRSQQSLRFLARHSRHIERVGGLLLVGVGILMITGRWLELFRPLQRWFAQWGWPPI